MRKAFVTFWNKRTDKIQYAVHVLLITGLVYAMLYLGSSFRINLKAINPLTKSLNDYEITDIVFSKFRDQSIIDLNEDIIIVNSGRPDRTKLLEALKRLDTFGVKSVGIDLLFDNYEESYIDSAFAMQVQSMPNLVLATVLGDYQEEQGLFNNVDGCSPEICKGVLTGYINFVAKPQHTIRLFSTNEKTREGTELAFAMRILQSVNPELAENILSSTESLQRINYSGNIESFLYYEMNQLLSDTEGISEIFKDKIVLIGYTGEEDGMLTSRDKFYTPLNERIAAKSLPDMYGLVIHANILSMLLNKSFITELPNWINRILEILIIMISVALFRMDFISFQQVFWFIIRILQIVMFLLLFYLVAGVFYVFDIRLNLNIGIIGALIAWDVVDLYENIIHPRLKILIFGKPDSSIAAFISNDLNKKDNQ